MGDFVIVTGDTVTIAVPGAVIPAAQGKQPLLGTSTDLTFESAFVCLEGDELPPALRGPLSYSEPAFPIPGTGTLKLTPTRGQNTTTVLTDSGKAVLLKGSAFTAVFTIGTPAMNPKGQNAPQSPKNGTAVFDTRNTYFTAD